MVRVGRLEESLGRLVADAAVGARDEDGFGSHDGFIENDSTRSELVVCLSFTFTRQVFLFSGRDLLAFYTRDSIHGLVTLLTLTQAVSAKTALTKTAIRLSLL